MSMFDLRRRLVRFAAGALIGLTLIGCGSGQPEATPTPLPLSVFGYEAVCRQGTIAEAAAYAPSAGSVSPLVLFDRTGTDQNSYNFSGNILFKLPEPWMVNYDGDPTKVQLVGCITRTAATPVDKCEFQDDEDSSKIYTLNTFDATYEVKLFEAQTGKEVAATSIDAAYGECPTMSMFSDDDTEEDGFASLNGADLQAFLKEHVEP